MPNLRHSGRSGSRAEVIGAIAIGNNPDAIPLHSTGTVIDDGYAVVFDDPIEWLEEYDNQLYLTGNPEDDYVLSSLRFYDSEEDR